MKRKRKHLAYDLFFIAVSIALAVLLVRSGTAHVVATSLAGFGYLGIFLAGSLFTSIFTTAPAIAILSELSQTYPIALVALLGGLGAVAGDYLIFRFIRDRFADDVRYLRSLSKVRRLPALFHTKLFHALLPALGALIIASPLPDELGLALLGLSRMNDRSFFLISFCMNALGILAIGLIANM